MGADREHQQRALGIAFALNGAFLVVEFVAGLVTGSLALLADAAHMLADVAALGVALLAHRLIDHPGGRRHTFGLQRAEVLGAQLNGLLLLAASGWIGWAAVRRLLGDEPVEIAGAPMLVVAVAGLVVNLVAARVLYRASGRSLNVRGAMAHLLADAAASVAAIVAGVALVTLGIVWVDAVASLVISAMVLWSGARLLRDTVHVLLEGVPRGLDRDDVEAALRADEAVVAVHHLHLWSLASDRAALSAHVVIDGAVTVHDAQDHVARLSAMLDGRFGIEHATLQVECHPHDDPR